MSLATHSAWFISLCLLTGAGCANDTVDDGGFAFGSGGALGSAGAATSSNGGSVIMLPPASGAGGLDGSGGAECTPRPVGLLRDFREAHPDFEYNLGSEKGIVLRELNTVTRKPVFSGMAGLRTVHTATEFDQWYNDVPGTNMTLEYTLPFQTSATGTAVYDNRMFFPLDGQLFGNEGRNHNFHFTFELHMTFRFSGTEIFSFRGDDDVFVFVNDKLAIDLGGVHEAESQTLDLGARAAELGIVAGQDYPIDFFQAERHTSDSNFRIETNLAFTNCDPIIVR